MKRLNGRLLLLLNLLAVVVLVTGCMGGTGSGGIGVGGKNPTVEYEVTGEITGEMDGDKFIRYTVAATKGGEYANTAEWDWIVDWYNVGLQGHRTKSPTDYEHAVSIDFILDKNLELVDFDSVPEISYFPEGLTFDPEKVYSLTEGWLELTEVKKDGDTLIISGEFAGTLHREVWVDEVWGDTELVDPLPIEGEFSIQKVTYRPL